MYSGSRHSKTNSTSTSSPALSSRSVSSSHESTTPGFRPHPQPPPDADPQLYQWFTSVDVDRSGAITATELQSALVNGAFVD